MKALKRVVFAAVPLMVASLLTAAAQAQVLRPDAWSTLRGGPIDQVDVSNLQIHFAIPVISKPGVLPLNYILRFDSGAWVNNGGHWGFASAFIGDPGFSPVTGAVQVFQYQNSCYSSRNDWDYDYNVYELQGYVDGQGVRHVAVDEATGGAIIVSSGFPSACDAGDDPGYPTSATGIARDGSGWSVTVNGSNGDAFATNPAGVSFDATGGRAYVWNPNGVQIQSTDGAHFTDSLGQANALVIGGSASSALTYSYKNPQGGTSQAQVNFTQFTVASNFGCPGIAEYSALRYLPTSIVLPDNTQYTIAYETTPYRTAGYTTGRMTAITLPAGGKIAYAYPGANDGMTCATATPTEVDRTVYPNGGGQPAEGTTAYTAGTVSGSPVTNAVDGAGNLTVYTFKSGYVAKEQNYSGSGAAATLLQTVQTCYNAMVPNCASAPAIAGGIQSVDRQVIVPAASGTLSRHTATTFQADYSGVLEVDESDWAASGEGGAWLRKTVTTNSATVWGEPTRVQILDGAGGLAAQTDYGYDTRRNPTSIQYTVGGGAAVLSRGFTYNTNGTVATATDVNGAVTSYAYNGAGGCNNALPTSASVTPKAGDTLTASMTWDCNGGVMTSRTGPDAAVTRWTYNDANFWRATAIQSKDSGGALLAENDLAYPNWNTVESNMTFNGGNSTVDVRTSFDGLGRAWLTQRKQGPAAGNYDTVQTKFDGAGRPASVSAVYSGTAGQAAPTGTAAATTTFDGLGRALSVNAAGGAVTSYTYTGNDVLRSLGPAPSGENLQQRQIELDGLGRLSSVCEVTSLAGSASCGQGVSQTGYRTVYAYNALDKMTQVTQNAQAAAADRQTRSFVFDALGRLTAETNPESGAVAYHFDSYGGCPTSNGDLVARVDAMSPADVTCYAHDGLHRVTDVTYLSGGAYAAVTAEKHFVYDAATVNSTVMAYAQGRLAEAYTGPAGAKVTDLGFSYDAMGRAQVAYQKSANSGGWYITTETHYANGAPAVLTLTGAPAITYGLDGEGRVATVNAASGQNPVTAASYGVNGLSSVTLGSTDTAAYGYDAATGRLAQAQFTVNGGTDTHTYTWNPNGSIQQLAVAGLAGASDTRICNYSHDDLGRLAGVDCGTLWTQTFRYDPFGNIVKTGTQSFGDQYGGNRISSNIGFAPNYDNNGGLLDNPVTSTRGANGFDAEGRMITIEGVAVVYDALGRAVEAAPASGTVQFVYGPDGTKLAVMSGQTLVTARVPLPGGSAAVYNGSGLQYYEQAAALGSTPLATTPSRGLYGARAYAPFGESYGASGSTIANFTGQHQDIASGDYDFLLREYNPVQGRWLSPDPAGLAAVNPNDPQSWNRYSYVGNTPLNAVDPLGLEGTGDGQCWEVGGQTFCSKMVWVRLAAFCLVAPAGRLTAGFAGRQRTPALLGASPSCLGSQMCQGDNDRCGILPWLNNLPIQYVDMAFDWFQNILTPRENGGGGGSQASAIHTGAGGRAAWLNSIFSVFGYDQNNPLPSCFGDVFLRTAADDLNPFTPSAGDVAKVAIGVGAAAQFNRALDYAAGRGLTSPFKSSVFRKLIGSSRQLATIAESAPLIYMVFSLGHGLLTEIRSLDRGECQ